MRSFHFSLYVTNQGSQARPESCSFASITWRQRTKRCLFLSVPLTALLAISLSADAANAVNSYIFTKRASLQKDCRNSLSRDRSHLSSLLMVVFFVTLLRKLCRAAGAVKAFAFPFTFRFLSPAFFVEKITLASMRTETAGKRPTSCTACICASVFNGPNILNEPCSCSAACIFSDRPLKPQVADELYTSMT